MMFQLLGPSAPNRWHATSVGVWAVRIVALAGLCALVVPAQANPRRQAAGAFRRGTRAFKAGDYKTAAAAYQQAYTFRPHFAVQCSIARCYQRLKQMVLAAKHYQRCLDEGGAKRGRSAAKIRKQLTLVRAFVGRYKVSSAVAGAGVFVDGRAAGVAPTVLELDQGEHQLELRKNGMRPGRLRVRVFGGEDREVTLSPVVLREDDDDRRPTPPPNVVTDPSVTGGSSTGDAPVGGGVSKPWFWVAVAVTGALTAAAVGFGLRALSARSAYEDNPTRDGYFSAIDSRTVANIFWGTAIAAAAGTTVLLFLTDFTEGSGSREVAAGNARFSLGVGIRGRF